jgi:hypothetical protein
MNDLSAFHWETQPEAERLLAELMQQCLDRAPAADVLGERLLHESGTRLLDWIDHLVVPDVPGLSQRCLAAGFCHRPTPMAPGCYRHDGGLFPTIVLSQDRSYALAIKVESVVNALFALKIHVPIAGSFGAPLRRARICKQEAEVWVVERHGYTGFEVVEQTPERAVNGQRHYEAFLLRQRAYVDTSEGFTHAQQLIDAAISDLGMDHTCDLFFAAERAYWQQRNRAAQIQSERQNRFGFGWANHDHHTYRSSRHSFTQLVSVFESLGFVCRERFYPGHSAGWGAQVLEQPMTGIVIFADVDMSEEEVKRDFAHEPFPAEEKRPLGTVGLWCALHGESFLQAGMHHLEATFAYDQACKQLGLVGIPTMPPFTNFPHLRQCFTQGEPWQVDPVRIDHLEQQQLITPAQAQQFRDHGAIGSHLEILERNQGFKGFNQQGVDKIIAGTDPRHAH